MTTKANEKAKASGASVAAPALIVFGLSDIGKPRAGTFPANEQVLAAKAAATMGFAILAVNDQRTKELAAGLPAGQVAANARGFIPFVRDSLFSEILPVAKDHGVKIDRFCRPTSTNDTNSPSKVAATQPRLPNDWASIAGGDLVLAQDTNPDDGWWKALVLKTSGEMLTLKWLTRVGHKNFVRHKFKVALLCGGLAESNSTQVSAKQPAYPLSPKSIAVGHTVLAPEEGPAQQWWEASPTEIKHDGLSLRWISADQLPPIRRELAQLALICPEPGIKALKAPA